MEYDAKQLNSRLIKALQERYPNFRSLAMVVSGEPGSGKSTVLASFPTTETRVIADNEDSMAYLDAGKDGTDIYEPRRQQFRMYRSAFPTMSDYATFYTAMKTEGKVGSFSIDNLAIFQDILVSFMVNNADNPEKIKEIFRKFDAETKLPNFGLMRTWGRNQDGNFWATAKVIPTQIILGCKKNKVHFISSTEETNVWVNYGTKDAKITGKKARIWDVWYRYTDVVVRLKRDVNTTKPPSGELYVEQPKNRLQGFNPSFKMDWEGFIVELEESAKRTSPEIPEETKVTQEEQFIE